MRRIDTKEHRFCTLLSHRVFPFFLVVLFAVSTPALGESKGEMSFNDILTMALKENAELRGLVVKEQVAQREERKALYERLPRFGLDFSVSHIANPQEAIGVDAGSLGELYPYYIAPEGVEVYVGPDPFSGPVPVFPGGPIPNKDITVVEAQDPFYYQFTLTMEQPVFTWGKLRGKQMIRETQRQAADTEAVQKVEELRTSIAILLMTLEEMDKIDAFLEKQERAAERLNTITEENFKNGFLLYQDVLETRVLLKEIEIASAEVKREKEKAYLALERLSGMDEIDHFAFFFGSIPENSGIYDTLSEEEMVERAYKRNLGIRLLELQGKAAKEEISIVRGKNYMKPDIGLHVEASVSGSRIPFIGDDWEDKNNWNLTSTIAFKTTVFDSGVISAEIDISEKKKLIAELELTHGKEKVKEYVKDSLLFLDLSKKKQELIAIKIETALEKMKIEKDQFESGAGREIHYLKEQINSYSLQVQLIKEIIEYRTHLFRLDNLVNGGTGEYSIYRKPQY